MHDKFVDNYLKSSINGHFLLVDTEGALKIKV